MLKSHEKSHPYTCTGITFWLDVYHYYNVWRNQIILLNWQNMYRMNLTSHQRLERCTTEYKELSPSIVLVLFWLLNTFYSIVLSSLLCCALFATSDVTSSWFGKAASEEWWLLLLDICSQGNPRYIQSYVKSSVWEKVWGCFWVKQN